MTKSNVWKKNRAIKALKEELENNKKVYDKNIELLNMRLELEKASLNDFNFEERRYKLNKEILDIELKNYRIVTPLMEFHSTREWQDKWKELKEFEIENNERNYKIVQKNFENQKKNIESRIDEAKIKEQQEHIQQRNPIILEQLKELGVNLDEVKEKHDYIG